MQKTIKPADAGADTSVILQANRFQFSAGERVHNRHVLSRMLLWCQEGKGRVRVNGAWHTMQPDDFLMLPWRHDVLYHADNREPFRVAGIHIIPDHAPARKLVFTVSHNQNDMAQKIPGRRDLPWPGLDGVRAGIARANEPLRLLADYIVERFDDGAIDESIMRKLTQVLVAEIMRTLAQKPASPQGNDVVRRAQELIESHYARQIPLRELARISQCSVSTLRRQFQQTLGLPPYEWILQARMRRARRLLSMTTLRIKEVAANVGFEDPFQFSRTFRQRVGKSPRQFRTDHAFAPRSSVR